MHFGVFLYQNTHLTAIEGYVNSYGTFITEIYLPKTLSYSVSSVLGPTHLAYYRNWNFWSSLWFYAQLQT